MERIELVAEAPHNRIGARGESYGFDDEPTAGNAVDGLGAERVMTVLYPNDPIGRNRPVDTAADITTDCIRSGSLGGIWCVLCIKLERAIGKAACDVGHPIALGPAYPTTYTPDISQLGLRCSCAAWDEDGYRWGRAQAGLTEACQITALETEDDLTELALHASKTADSAGVVVGRISKRGMRIQTRQTNARALPAAVDADVEPAPIKGCRHSRRLGYRSTQIRREAVVRCQRTTAAVMRSSLRM